LSVLSHVSESIKSDILLIKRFGVGKAIIEIKTSNAANRLISYPVFDKNDFQAFILSFKIFRIRIIKGIDQSISMNYLRENLNNQNT